MALANTRDPQQSAAQLTAWLKGKTGAGDVSVTGVETPQASGLSNETLLFTASWTENGENRATRPSVKPNALDCAAAIASAATDGSCPLYASYRTKAAAATMRSYAAIGTPMNGVTSRLPTA